MGRGKGGAQFTLGQVCRKERCVQNAKPSSEWQGRGKNRTVPFSLLNSEAGGMHFEILTTISCNCCYCRPLPAQSQIFPRSLDFSCAAASSLVNVNDHMMTIRVVIRMILMMMMIIIIIVMILVMINSNIPPVLWTSVWPEPAPLSVPLSTSQRRNYFLPLITRCNNFKVFVYFRSGMMYKKSILKARYI